MKTEQIEVLEDMHEKFIPVDVKTLDSKKRISLGEKILKMVADKFPAKSFLDPGIPHFGEIVYRRTQHYATFTGNAILSMLIFYVIPLPSGGLFQPIHNPLVNAFGKQEEAAVFIIWTPPLAG